MKWFYEITYRYFRAPWDIGPRNELVALVESGRLKPCRAIDLGCGAGANAIFLAQRGFDVTGVDFSPAAIGKAQARAKGAGVNIKFIVDDLTNSHHSNGAFDLLVDYGVSDDMGLKHRALFVNTLLALTHPGSHYVLWCFEYPVRWWERIAPFMDLPYTADEVQARFAEYFEIEKIAGELDWSKFPPGYAAYLMTRKEDGM